MRTNRPPRPFGVNVAGYFRAETGVGEAARRSVRALQAVQVPHVLNEVADPASLGQERFAGPYAADNPYLVNLVHVNADQVPVFVSQRGRGYFRNHYNIGCWFWELSRFPEEWVPHFAYFDEIWAMSSFVLEALSRASPIPVVKMPLASLADSENPPPAHRSRFGMSPDGFWFLSMFDFRSVLARKNPLGVIAAFKRAFPGKDQGVGLVLKSTHAETHPAGLEVVRAAARGYHISFVDGAFSRAETTGMLSACDCYVSLHRSEGFGLPIAEAMQLGKPVVVTGYSGNMDFTTPANSFLVNYQLVELADDHGPYARGSVWAEPDLDHAAEVMRYVYENSDARNTAGQQGREDILRLFDPRHVGACMQERLHGVVLRGAAGRKALRESWRTGAGGLSTDGRAVNDLGIVHDAGDGANAPETSEGGRGGSVLAFTKKAFRRLLAPILSGK